jgi:hypothetical protein
MPFEYLLMEITLTQVFLIFRKRLDHHGNKALRDEVVNERSHLNSLSSNAASFGLDTPHLIKDEIGISGGGRGKVNGRTPFLRPSNILGSTQLVLMSCRPWPSGGDGIFTTFNSPHPSN